MTVATGVVQISLSPPDQFWMSPGIVAAGAGREAAVQHADGNR
jgi:hypothetical protein